MVRALVFVIICFPVSAQIRMNKLVIERNQNYSMAGSDILVADTLILNDSSRITLNRLTRENYIRTKLLVIGKNSMIIGNGIDGKNGNAGTPGKMGMGPCQNGQPGKNGGTGLDGSSANDLFLYVDSLVISEGGSFRIDLFGGDGGNGGNGGEGGGGSPGTNHCAGGNGGNGGNAGNGGSGGNGGKLHIGGSYRIKFRSLVGEKIVLRLKGGTFGYGGVSGFGGPAGLGKKHGTTGVRGKEGRPGRPGNVGQIIIEAN